MTPHLVGTLCGIGVIANNGGWGSIGKWVAERRSCGEANGPEWLARIYLGKT